MNRERSNNVNNFITWTALIISVVALALAVKAQQPSQDTPLSSIFRQNPQQSQLLQDTQEGLASIADSIESGATEEEVDIEISQLRENLKNSYQSTEGTIQTQWQAVDSWLEELQDSSTETIDQAIEEVQSFLEVLQNDLNQ